MAFILFNAAFSKSQQPIAAAANRGLRYGYGCFETMRFVNGKLILADKHFGRFADGIEKLGFKLPQDWSAEKWNHAAATLAKKNGLERARIRLTAFADDGGLYEPWSATFNWIMEALPLSETTVDWHPQGLSLCLFDAARKSSDTISALKTNNAMVYALGARHAKAHQCNDAFIVNNAGRIIESSIANIFIVQNNTIITPALTEGCVAGIMRAELLAFFAAENITCTEGSISKEALVNAHEVFLTNAAYPLRPVTRFEEKSYQTDFTRSLYDRFRAKRPDIFP